MKKNILKNAPLVVDVGVQLFKIVLQLREIFKEVAMFTTIRETQKQAFDGAIIDYPVSKIQIVDNHTFFIKCRDHKNANTFKAITTAYGKTFQLVTHQSRSYQLVEKSPTEFILRGEDAQEVLNDFSETGLLSNTLLKQVISTANFKKPGCTIS